MRGGLLGVVWCRPGDATFGRVLHCDSEVDPFVCVWRTPMERSFFEM